MSLDKLMAANALLKINDIYQGYNFDRGLKDYKAAIADVERNPIIITVLGTSISDGYYASDIITKNWNGRLRTLLQAKYGDVGVGSYRLPPSASDTHTPWVLVGSWAYNNNSLCARRITGGGAAGITASLTFIGTEITLIYNKGSDGSNGTTITIDGVSKTAPDFYSATTVINNTVTYSGLTNAEHTIVITADPTAGKKCHIAGALVKKPTTSGDKGCYLYNFAVGGAKTSNFTASASNIVPITHSHLVIIELGANNLSTTADFATELDAIVAAIKANTGVSVLLLPCYEANTTEAFKEALKTNRRTMYQVAEKYNCALLDIWSMWGSWDDGHARGLWGSGSYDGNAGDDIVHLSDKGHRLLGNMVADILL